MLQNSHLGNKSVLIAVSNHTQLGSTGNSTGYWLTDVSHTYYALKRAGYSVEFVSPKGSQANADRNSMDMSDDENLAFTSGLGPMGALDCTTRASRIEDPSRFAAILFAGGHGSMWDFPLCRGLQRLAREIYESGGVVAAVGKGTSALVNLKLSDGSYLVAGKHFTSTSDAEELAMRMTKIVPFSLEQKLTERGGIYEKAFQGVGQPHVVNCLRLLTGQNAASARALGEALAAELDK